MTTAKRPKPKRRAGKALTDPNLDGLRLGIMSMERVEPRMRKATLQFLWDKYVTRAKPELPS